jgi:epoxyqueuosine reductase
MRLTSAEIRKKAAEVGIDRVGIVRAEILEEQLRRLEAWLGEGFHGTMAWMAREPTRRADPRSMIPDVRSVIVGAVNYYVLKEHAPHAIGKISRYAWGDDYHDILRERFEALVLWMKSIEPGLVTRICVDTAPFLDKAWAVRAGLGWIGKHSNLITTDYGSWVFIGSILVNAELEYDAEQVPDHCGTCTACIEACPTEAIVRPYVVDSRKCISYATIELRDASMPSEIAKSLNGWLYGCDICQDVCPWNRFEKPTMEKRFEPRNGETAIEPERILEMEPKDYVERFRRSAIKRAKLDGLKRNAAALRDAATGKGCSERQPNDEDGS